MMLSTDNPSKGNKKGITEIIQRVIEQDPTLDKPGIEDSIIQILEFLLTGQPKQKGAQDGLTKTVIDVVSGTPFMYEYDYNQEDQLTNLYDPITDKEYTYSYDIRGNLTSKKDYYGNYNYKWDHKNRLTEAVTPNKTIKYTYDSKDRRVSKTVIDIDASSSVIPAEAGIQTHTYKYDGWAIMEEEIAKTTTVNGEPLAENQLIKYTYNGADSPTAITIGDNTYYCLTDGHGDIREITDKEGTTLVKYSYDAWGNPTTTTIPPSLRGNEATEAISQQLIETNPYTYASYRYDSDTGMYYLRARYYDPVIGRFLSRDPIVHENLYPYAGNNPVNAVDTSGMKLSSILPNQINNMNHVYILQDALRHIRKYSNTFKPRAPHTGLYDKQTLKVVKEFQKWSFNSGTRGKNANDRSGNVAQVTWEKIFYQSLRLTNDGTSSPCRDNVGHSASFFQKLRPGYYLDEFAGARTSRFAFSDCYYSVKWLGKIGYEIWGGYYGARSICEFAEYNPMSKTKVGIRKDRPIAYEANRWCKWGSTTTWSDNPQVCSEDLPMAKIINWRKHGALASEAYKLSGSFFPSPLWRPWPNSGFAF